ncbi:type II toxin-antitoxin system Phd/YefM family antitoxin [uncultured Parasphingorhabdus sp.]|uniref:type II toxin-antitoxin system Phd/YefM family antitoxin n=1 Tax=uncultured Parasphingorhabdus sp. TaxID=2709694 RepID=UPI002AA704EC|nr:type II toxin-antitoxin system Phd/YefM family antitoxin [uncultured Parasphingorhabdus sp.]
MPIINITNAQNNLFKLVEAVIASGEPLFITGESGNVVVIPEKDYRAIEETLHLAAIPGMVKKIVEGINTPLDECVSDENLPRISTDG